jgi:TseV toxin immunity protein TsiV
MATANTSSEQFTADKDGVCYLKLCLDVTLYFEDSLFDHSKEVIEFYKRSLQIIGPHIRFYQTENMGKARKITEKALEMLPFWFTTPSSRRPILMFFLESGPTPNDVSDHAFLMCADEINAAGSLRLMLPVTRVEESVTDFRALARDLANTARFSSGHAGFSVNFHIPGKGDYAGEADVRMYALSQRYPGLDLFDTSTSKYASLGIKCADWLTFINPSQIEKLGGMDNLVGKLGKDAVHPLKHGVMIQAGPKPELGDVNRGLTLPEYHRVGRLLKAIRMTKHPHFLAGDEQISMRWLARFDE